MDIVKLSDNTTVVTGFFSLSTTFGSGEPNQTILTSAGSFDIFIARYNTDGTLAWAKRAGGISVDGGKNGINALSDNTTVVTGWFQSSAIFGQLEPNQTTLVSAGLTDIYIARFNTNGTLAWAKRAGGTGMDTGSDVTPLSDNTTVVTGSYSGSATFGLLEPNQTDLTAVGLTDIFFARYNTDGTLSWIKSAGGTGSEGGMAITTLSDNSIVVFGNFDGSSTFGPGEPDPITLTSAGVYDIFIARYIY